MSTTIDTLKIVIDGDCKGAILEVDKLTASLNNLKKSSKLTTTVNNLIKLSNALEGIKAGQLGAVEKKLQVIQGIKLNKLYKDVQGLRNELNRLSKVNIDRINNKLEKTSKLSVAKKGKSRLLGAISGLAIGNYLGSSITQINKAIESANLFKTTMGSYYEEAHKWSTKVQDTLGIDLVQFEEAQGTFMAMAKGMGISAEQSYKLSKGLTEMAYDLASFRNLDVVESFNKLKSALAGEVEPLRAVGVSITQATLQEKAHALGIKEKVNMMTDAEKSLLRYQVILDSLRNMGAIGDMAKTLESPANALRILKMQLIELSRAIGSLFIPILTAVLPYVSAFVQVITKLIRALATLVGFKMPEWDTKDWSKGETATGGVANNLDKANKKAKELKRNIQGFDELHILEAPKDNTGGTGGLGGGTGFDMAIEDVWNNAMLDSVSSKTAMIMQELEEKVKRLVILLKEPFEGLNTQPLIDSLERLKTALEPFKDTVGQGLYWFYLNVLVPIATWSIEDGLPTFINSIASALEYLHPKLEDIGTWIDENKDKIGNTALILTSLYGAFTLFTSIPWSTIITGLSSFIGIFTGKTNLLNLIPFFSTLSTMASTLGIGLGPLVAIIGGLATVIYTLFVNWDKVTETIGKFLERIGFTDMIENIVSAFGNLIASLGDCSELFQGLGTMIITIISTSMTPFIGVATGVFNAIGPIIDVVADLLGALAGLGEFVVGIFLGDFKMAGEGIEKCFQKLKSSANNIALTVIAFFQGTLSGLGNWVRGLFDNLGSWVSEIITNVKNWFKDLLDGLPQWAKDMLNAGKTVITGIGSAIGNIFGGRSYEIPVTAYASGGVIEDGLFTMNHGEIAGRFDNGQSVVANNEQIIEGIARGVANGLQQGNTDREININVDGRTLASVIVDFINTETNRTGRSPINIY